MAIYDFTLILSDPDELRDEFVEQLFEAGCDDGTPSSSEGTLCIDFNREASDLESAIRSAISNVSAAGGVVDRVEIDADAPVLKN